MSFLSYFWKNLFVKSEWTGEKEMIIAKYTGSGVMVAIKIPPSVAGKIALEGGEPAEDLHITLAYCGKMEDMKPGVLSYLPSLVYDFARYADPITARINGLGRFTANESTDGRDVIYATVDSPTLLTFRQQLVRQLVSEGVPVKLNHGFIPHITLKYIEPKESSPIKRLEEMSLDVISICVYSAGTVQEFPLTGPVYKAELKNSKSLICPIEKIDEDQHTVFGWASIIEEAGQTVVDKQGDIIDEATLEKAAYQFALDSRRGDAMHEKRGVGTLIESIVFSKRKQQALGIDLGKIGWWIGYKIEDEATWEKVKSGEYKAFSIGGMGTREEIGQ